MNDNCVLVTGAAGFIGSSFTQKLLRNNYRVIGIDNFFPNYSKNYKLENLQRLFKFPNFSFYMVDITNHHEISTILKNAKPWVLFHFAALAGVRVSKKIPDQYINTNFHGTTRLYELCCENNVNKFVFASSSSVYGSSDQTPFQEDGKLAPQSVYAKTKQDAEIHLTKLHQKLGMQLTILRFFSVYGPAGRPDMAPYLFTEAAFKNTRIIQYGDGTSARDYTYIDDICAACFNVLDLRIPYSIINIGNSDPVSLYKLITTIEMITGKKIQREQYPDQIEEAHITYASIEKAKSLLHWEPKVDIEQGLRTFIQWYKYYRL